MKIEKIDINGKKQSIDVADKIFACKINKELISRVLYKSNANFKGRKAKTKQKNEITGSTSKIYAQKGTGNARHASRKAPIFIGGGVAHGPKGETNYKIRKLNKSEKKLSVISLITEKNKFNNLIVIDDFDKEINKTREMVKFLKKINADNSLMILDRLSKEKVLRSSRNIPNIKVSDVNHFSSYDLAKYKKLLLTTSSIKELEKKILMKNKLNIYDKILFPVVTEKSTNMSELNKITFKVPLGSNKKSLKNSVEKLFKVNVIKVNIINKKTRYKISRGKKISKKGYKKAIITLKKGQNIDLTTGL